MLSVAIITISAAQAIKPANCTSENCCSIDVPQGYCGLVLPYEPISIGAKFLINNLEEIDEEKLSFTINLR